MKDFVLINLPSPFLENPKAMPPQGILYIAAACEQAGMDVGIADLAYGLSSEKIPMAGCYGISATTPLATQIPDAVNLCYASNHNAAVVVGGPHVTEERTPCGADVSIGGEADIEIVSVVSDLLMSPRRFSGHIQAAKRVKDLDTLPMPAYHLLKMYQYGQPMSGYQTATISGARGCPFNCSFCSKGVFGNSYRRRSNDHIMAEVELLKGYGFKAIHFLDDTMFVGGREHQLVDLCLKMRDAGMLWKCLLRTDLVDKTMLTLMHECGCQEIAYGIESGSQKLLDRIHKNNTVEQNTKAVRWTEEVGIRAKAFLIIGLPGESIGTIMETKAWFEAARPSNFTITTLRPFKGSPIYAEPDQFGIEIHTSDPAAYSYRGKDDLVSVVSTANLSADEITKYANQLDSYFRKLTRIKVA